MFPLLAFNHHFFGTRSGHLFVRFQAGFNPPRVRLFFFGVAVERERRGGLLSIAARKMRLMRV
jgi:hypothetical protein